ncbi:polysaccharide biosynthesis/export family protein [Halocynthiibacter namhaensis]|uniref:polysaccharide biosynthesis/export family protein n=1 Tax=Halocynthiibacter namhaensis TaxID=1290553 RepID=UPI001EE2F147|nr:polysaccharide biosynthesis/export family protein [Halocynthiibacter namhaensis]
MTHRSHRHIIKSLGLTILMGMISACGVAYHSPRVIETSTNGTDVNVIPMTPQNVALANQSPYTPRRIPNMFSQHTGTMPTARGAVTIPIHGSRAPQTEMVQNLRLPPEITPSPYHIGVGDVIVLATRQGNSSLEELTGLLAAQNRRLGYTVQDDGAITIPDVGRVNVAMMTLEEAEAEIFRALVEHQIDPVFSVEISEFNSSRVSIAGAVAQPQIANLGLTPLYMNEALTRAGGLQISDTDTAIIRLYRSGSLYRIPLSDYFAQPDLQNLPLAAGDAVYVDAGTDPQQARAYFEEQIQLANLRQSAHREALNALSAEMALSQARRDEARSNFAARQELGAVARDFVYLTGEIAQQGRFTLPYEQRATLADAIFEGGGGLPNATANPREIYVLRTQERTEGPSTMNAWHLDARNAINLLQTTRFELRPNDIIFIAEQPVTRWGRVVNQISPSLITTPMDIAATN